MQTKTEAQLNQGWDYYHYCRAALEPLNTLSLMERHSGLAKVPCKQLCDHNQKELKELNSEELEITQHKIYRPF